MSLSDGGRDPRSSSTHRRTYALVALLLVAALALAFGAGLGAAAPGADASAQQAAASGTLQEDQLEEGERGHVQDSTSPPYSSTVSVYRSSLRKPNKELEPASSGGMGSGVLVSDRHVVTAAHVVVDEGSREPIPEADLKVAPGANADTDHVRLPYGTANVESVYMEANPYTTGWEGYPSVLGDYLVDSAIENVEVDFAILTLDRPVGLEAGTMEPAEPPTDRGTTIMAAGYPSDKATSEQWLSKGWQEAINFYEEENIAEMHVPVEPGNSGGPYWVAGEPDSVVGVMSQGHPVTEWAAASIFTESRIDRVDEQIAHDGAAPILPDLAVVETNQEGLFGRYTPALYPEHPTVVGEQGFVEATVTLFNNGPGTAGGASGDVEVAFYLVDQDTLVRDVGDLDTEMCTDSIEAVDPYDQRTVSCAATDFSDLDRNVGDDGLEMDVYAAVDPDDEVAEYTDDERSPVKVRQGITFENAEGWQITEVDEPDSVDAGETFEVDVTVRNYGTSSDSVEVTIDGGEYADCSGASEIAYAQPEETAERTLECSADDVGSETSTLTATAGPASAEASVLIERPPDDRGEFAATDVTLDTHTFSDDEVERYSTYHLEATVENVGSEPGVRQLFAANEEFTTSVRQDPDYFACHLDSPDQFETVRLDPGERTDVSLGCRVPKDVTTTRYHAQIVDRGDKSVLGDVTYFVEDQSESEFDVDNVNLYSDADGIDAVPGQPSELLVEINNFDGGGDDQTLEVAVDGETVHTTDVYVAKGGWKVVETAWTPASDFYGDVDITATVDDDEETVTERVEHVPFGVAFDGAPSSVVPEETTSVDVTVSNDGSVADVHQLELSVDATVVAQRDVALEDGDARSITLTGYAPEDLPAENATLRIETETDAVEATVGVEPHCVEFEGNEACDVDGDGNYRDVNADGSVSNGDVNTFFEVQHAPAWDSRPEYFDFDGDGDVGQGDVVALYEYVND